LIEAGQTFIGCQVFKVLDSNVLAKSIDVGKQFTALSGSGFFIASAERVI
jgi:hypothetical protein